MSTSRWRSSLILAVAGLTATALSVPATAAAGTAAPAAIKTSAEQSYSSDTVIVKYKAGSSSLARSAVQKLAGVLGTVAPIHGTGAYTLRVAGDPKAVVARLNRSAAVEYAELNAVMTTQATPNDPLYPEL